VAFDYFVHGLVLCKNRKPLSKATPGLE
jgi:hypothetical protein